jgi:hypothetical protein
MLTFAAERPMDLEVKTLTDAPAGLRSPERGSRGNTSPGAKGLLREHSSQLRLGRLQGKDEHRPHDGCAGDEAEIAREVEQGAQRWRCLAGWKQDSLMVRNGATFDYQSDKALLCRAD